MSSYLSPIRNCNNEELIWVYLAVICGVLCFLSALFVGYLFIKRTHQTEKAAMQKYLEICYVLLVCITLALISISNACICVWRDAPQSLTQIMSLLVSLMVSFDAIGFELILFVRLYYVFRHSIWKLSQCSIIYFAVLFAITPCFYIFMVVVYNMYNIMNPMLSAVLNGLAALCTMGLILSVMGLFTHRLYRVYQMDSTRDPIFLEMIKTSTILIVVSFSTKISMTVFISMRERYDIVSIYYIAKLCTYLNVYVDFMCIVLAHHSFHPYYRKICFLVEVCCTQMCCNEWFCKNKLKFLQNEALMVETQYHDEAERTDAHQSHDTHETTRRDAGVGVHSAPLEIVANKVLSLNRLVIHSEQTKSLPRNTLQSQAYSKSNLW